MKEIDTEKIRTYQTTSVLPKQPCEKCGGSGEVPNPAYIKHCKDKENIPRHMRTRDNPYPTTIPCHACQALHQNGTGQAPAGNIKEFVRIVGIHLDKVAENFPIPTRINIAETSLKKACTHLTAQAKEAENFRRLWEATRKLCKAQAKQEKELRAEIKELKGK